ncbi:hypothetical protein C7382_106129 [Porphyromonas loveana]|uniref:Uncharacterized protein n=1 Tax=Porphyromonas loveana TaxID=1884669 RepID=A0A2U1FHM0_9PORP|nr:hypothetical protein C7382_106129 [Porphyromonas loveana]
MLYKQWHRFHFRVQDIAWINSYFYSCDITLIPQKYRGGSLAQGACTKGKMAVFSSGNAPQTGRNMPRIQVKTRAIFISFWRHFRKIYAPNRKIFGASLG